MSLVKQPTAPCMMNFFFHASLFEEKKQEMLSMCPRAKISKGRSLMAGGKEKKITEEEQVGFAAGHQFGLVIDRYDEIRLCDLVVIVFESIASQPRPCRLTTYLGRQLASYLGCCLLCFCCATVQYSTD